MSMNDPIADMLTRLRNAQNTGKATVEIPASRIKEDMCKVLQREGFIAGFEHIEDDQQGMLRVTLRYREDGRPVIQELRRVSKPSLRVYNKRRDLQMVRSGLGIAIVTTSKGVMTEKQARESNVGGEVLCEVW